MDDLNNAHSVMKLVAGGLYAGFGGFVHYLYKVSKEGSEKFSWFMFTVNVLVSFFLGQAAWEFIPDSISYKAGLIMVAGSFVSYTPKIKQGGVFA